MKKKLRIGLASVNGSSRRTVFGMLLIERLHSLNQPALEYPNAGADRFMRGAHHRRCAREGLTEEYDALTVSIFASSHTARGSLRSFELIMITRVQTSDILPSIALQSRQTDAKN